ncbi:MAG: DUF3850 domain-containing protein [Pseudomonadota bacterium]
MKTHNLKIDEKYFLAIVNGKKKFEIRKNDRDFSEGDRVNLNWYGNIIKAEIGFVTDYSQRKGYVVFSLLNIECEAL